MGEKPKEGELFPALEKNPRGLRELRNLRAELETKSEIKKRKERQERIDEILGRNKKNA
ncbi:MAG: hypothetical protein HYW15_00340 [Candidatus Giovannonibacteria bacterium]|nr:MAG: hypothetical protein HYW15_00340 [Candidatus Giovannonibacteria bacterium]